ncbi:MAG: pyrroline-5-carboxylate reductase [Tannerellaceae bacterium]|jgi:pyrroline-5-carboxylate reductase|nr:pyrroline-5-carboxylate reductase [Tannerellaceae bacterium]
MRIAIIGTGNMGGAIARGILRGGMLEASDITCTTRTGKVPNQLRKALGNECVFTTDNREAVREAEIILLCVKPWRVKEVIEDIRPVLDFGRHTIVSVAAGVSTDQLTEWLVGDGEYAGEALPAVLRMVLNTAVGVGNSMTFICSVNASHDRMEFIADLFGGMGHVMELEEGLMPAATALSSCGLAYAMRYIRAAIEGGIELGFSSRQAQNIVLQTVKGAADLLLENNSHPEREIDRVTTPGGITIRGLNEMEHAGFTSAVIRGLKASI